MNEVSSYACAQDKPGHGDKQLGYGFGKKFALLHRLHRNSRYITGEVTYRRAEMNQKPRIHGSPHKRETAASRDHPIRVELN